MLFSLPEKEELYTALVNRDPSYEGRAYVGVRTTGIFCRFTCPARKPKVENCEFFEAAAHCMEAGFRPCKRCRPLEPSSTGEPAVQRLMKSVACFWAHMVADQRHLLQFRYPANQDCNLIYLAALQRFAVTAQASTADRPRPTSG